MFSFLSNSKLDKIRDAFYILYYQAFQDGEFAKQEAEALGYSLNRMADRLGIKIPKNFAEKEFNNLKGESFEKAIERIKTWSSDEKVDLLNDLLLISLADEDLSMPEIHLIFKWADIWDDIDEEAVIESVFQNPKLLEQFPTLSEDYKRYTDSIIEIGEHETRDKYNEDRTAFEKSRPDSMEQKETEQDSTYCSKCGTKIKMKDKFCTNCGEKQ